MKRKILILLACFGLIVASCKREGCTDTDADNFDAKAKKNTGCQYTGSVVFWHDETTAQNLMNDQAISLTYYVNGQLIGSSAASVYFTGPPACDQNNAVSTSFDLGGSKTKSFSYSVKDQTGHEYWKGTIILNGGICLKQELEF